MRLTVADCERLVGCSVPVWEEENPLPSLAFVSMLWSQTQETYDEAAFNLIWLIGGGLPPEVMELVRHRDEYLLTHRDPFE